MPLYLSHTFSCSPVPLQNRTSGFPIHPALRSIIQIASKLRDGFRSLLSVSGQCSSMLTLCIVSMFLLSRAIDRGDLRSAGISRFIAKPLRLHWSPSLASASFGRLLSRWSTILGYYPNDLGCFHQEPLGAFSDARLVTPSSLSCSMLSETPGCRLVLVHNAPSVSPAPLRKR